MTVLLDDHLLRDWMARRDGALVEVVGDDDIATTNLWYVRLCKSAAAATGGALLAGWEDEERRALIGGLVALADNITVVPMRELAWHIGVLVADHRALSTLGAEAVAAAVALEGRILVSARDDGPGIRRCCELLGVGYESLAR